MIIASGLTFCRFRRWTPSDQHHQLSLRVGAAIDVLAGLCNNAQVYYSLLFSNMNGRRERKRRDRAKTKSVKKKSLARHPERDISPPFSSHHFAECRLMRRSCRRVQVPLELLFEQWLYG
jgi:hypothetical protein